MDEVGHLVQELLSGRSVTTDDRWLRQGLGPVYVDLREDGISRARAWGDGATVVESLTAAVGSARDELADPQRINGVELCFSHDDQPVSSDDPSLTNAHVGVLGLELRHGNAIERYSPTQMLAFNTSFARMGDRFIEAYGLDVDSVELEHRVFSCEQALILLSGGGHRTVRMERGSRTVPLEDVDRDSVIEARDLMGGWMIRALHDDGRMTYKYWPSRGEESEANNMIRQWMATVALTRLGYDRPDLGLHPLAHRNIRYNLDNHFYVDDDGLGAVADPDGAVKLGAVALAALALIEHPDRADFAAEESALLRTVDHLWQDDGAFRTFLVPPERNDNQNFYPGEALLMWAVLLREDGPDPELLERFMRSFRYYREWHLEEGQRNPAFVPWHTQAYYEVWRLTHDEELADFIFEMNDWLLDVQQWDDAPYPDMRGRFYDPSRPFGPPHSSSTGVYLEGLIDAYQLALELNESARAESYRVAIRRGLRSVMQLQFVDDVDTYYISRKDRVIGGIRTTVYDNEIRVDNVQHNLMAVLKILQHMDEHALSG